MYSDTGEKIERLAQTLLVIGVIASIILGIFLGSLFGKATDEPAIGIFAGVIVFTLGCISSYLSDLLLAGYGELIANTAETHRQIKTLRKEIDELKNAIAPQNKKQSVGGAPNRKEYQKSNLRRVSCGNCGYDQEYSGRCPKCGSSIKKYSRYDEAEDACEYIAPTEDYIEETAVDYKLAQIIQQKVSTFPVQKTREQLERLKQIPVHTLSPEDLAQLQYEIEACEIHLLELTEKNADRSNICPVCGTESEAHAKFCSKCGTAIQ